MLFVYLVERKRLGQKVLSNEVSQNKKGKGFSR
jgi:hypothetical protein